MRRLRPAERVVLGLVVLAAGVGAFFAGRASKGARPAITGSYAAGREAAFEGFDGGWSYGEPYIVVLRRGGPGVTYAFASRRPLLPGFAYSRCEQGVCASHVR